MGDVDAAVMRTERGDWMSEHLATYLESGGARGHIVDLSSVGGREMTTHCLIKYAGRKSRTVYVKPRIYGNVGGEIVVVASKGGADDPPAWYVNLEANPSVTVQDRGDVNPAADFTFTITVEVKPTVELAQYTGLEVVYPQVDVADIEVDQQVKARLEGQIKLTEVTDRGVQKGDMVLVELVAKDGDTEVAREPGTTIRTEADPYDPGVEALLEGCAIGEERTGKVAFPATARIETVAGRELDVTAKVVSIQHSEVPALSDELAAELGYEGGAEGMKTAIRLQLQEGRDGLARNQARANLLQVLINANPFEVPASMIDQHLEMLIEELKLQQAYRGRDPRRVTFSEEQLADLRIRGEFAAKGGLILDYVAKKEGLAITDADLESKYLELADQRGQTVEAIRGYFVKDDAVEELRARLMEEKTLDWLLENSKLLTSDNDTPPEAAPAP
jgi:trigger factor